MFINEHFTKGNKKETGRKKEKTKNKKGWREKKQGSPGGSFCSVCLPGTYNMNVIAKSEVNCEGILERGCSIQTR